jgi:hypothetical protein
LNHPIVNNFSYGNRQNFFWWQGTSSGGLVNTLIAYNAFVNPVELTNFQISSGSHFNSQIRNNIILQEDSIPIAIVDTINGLTLSNNLQLKAPPSGVLGTSEIIVDPLLAKASLVCPGGLTADFFKIGAPSPATGKAMVLNEKKNIFFDLQEGPART